MACNALGAGLRTFGRKITRVVARITEKFRSIDVSSIKHALVDWLSRIKNWIIDNKEAILTLIGAAAVIAIVVVVCVKLLPLILAGMGFTVSRVAAGSLATAVQAWLGVVIAGSPFAIFMSAAMGGYGLVVLKDLLWAIAAFVTAAVMIWNTSNKHDGKEDEEKDKMNTK